MWEVEGKILWLPDWFLLMGMKWTNKLTARVLRRFGHGIAYFSSPFKVYESELMWDCLLDKQYVLFPPPYNGFLSKKRKRKFGWGFWWIIQYLSYVHKFDLLVVENIQNNCKTWPFLESCAWTFQLINSFIASRTKEFANVTFLQSKGRNFSHRKKFETRVHFSRWKKTSDYFWSMYLGQLWGFLPRPPPHSRPSFAYRFFKWESNGPHSLLCAKLLLHSFRPKTTSSFLHNLLTPGQENDGE